MIYASFKAINSMIYIYVERSEYLAVTLTKELLVFEYQPGYILPKNKCGAYLREITSRKISMQCVSPIRVRLRCMKGSLIRTFTW